MADDQIEQELLKRSLGIDHVNRSALDAVTGINTGDDASDPAGTSATHAGLTAAHGATGAVVGTTNVQTITGKKFGGATDYSEFEASGFLHHAGIAGGYDDVQFNITPKETGAGHPTLSTWNTDFKEFSYAVGDYANAQSQEAPHWWKEGEPWSFHIHWSTGSGNYVNGDKVQWQLHVSAADTNGSPPYTQFPAATVLVIEHAFVGTVSPFSGVRSTFPTFTIPASMTKIGAQVKIKLTRIAKSAGGTDPGTDPFPFQVGAHALADTRTSRTNGAK